MKLMQSLLQDGDCEHVSHGELVDLIAKVLPDPCVWVDGRCHSYCFARRSKGVSCGDNAPVDSLVDKCVAMYEADHLVYIPGRNVSPQITRFTLVPSATLLSLYIV